MSNAYYQFRFFLKGWKAPYKEAFTDFTGARCLGNEIGDDNGRVEMYCYNRMTNVWEHLGAFLGHHRFVAAIDGEMRIISDDYTTMLRKGVTL